MMETSKLNLRDEVRPEWRQSGVPTCSFRECPTWDPARDICGVMGVASEELCEPAIEAMARAIPGFLTCERCNGSGTVARDCALCGDSTFDHECNDGPAPCPRCNGTGKPHNKEDAR